jgi:hypothetical protein
MKVFKYFEDKFTFVETLLWIGTAIPIGLNSSMLILESVGFSTGSTGDAQELGVGPFWETAKFTFMAILAVTHLYLTKIIWTIVR